VVDVKPGSVAEDMNLTRGVVILDLNRKPVTGVEDFQNRINALKSGDDVVMLVRYPGRGGGSVLLSGTMP
ncbi:MAG: peptidase S1, partial [Acidobacteriaceae bacterium]